MPHVFIIAGLLLANVFLAGCHGKVSELHLPDMDVTPAMQEESRLAIAVAAFQDQRPESDHVGIHAYRGNDKEYFNLKDGSLNQAITHSFIHFLKQSGFSVSTAASGESADVRIEADIEQFDVNVTDGILYSLLAVDTTIAFTIHNLADKSTVRVTVGAGESNEAIVFGHHDLGALINSMLKQGFTKLMKTVTVRGQSLKIAHHVRPNPQFVSQRDTTPNVLRVGMSPL